jgi:hypothetical protein
MNNKVKFQFEWSSWIKWVCATALGFIINDGVFLFIPNPSVLAFLYSTFLVGLIVALFQWMFVLRSLALKAHRWIFVSIIGWGAGSLLVIPLQLQPGTALLIIMFISGAVLGAIQWAFFIRKLYIKSYLWIFFSAIGMPIADGLSWVVIFPIVLGNYNGLFSFPLHSAIRGSLFGAVTGICLIWLSRRSREEKDSAFLNAQ